MAAVHKVNSTYALSQVGVIRDRESPPGSLRSALWRLGEEMGKRISELYYTENSAVITPMGDEVQTLIPNAHSTVVITTKADLDCFGTALASVLEPANLGYMDFEGRRGLAALSAPIREIELPKVSGPVDFLIIAKSTLATGCTAISLTKTAMHEYTADKLIIASIFYSMNGVRDLQHAFPHSPIFIVGEPDHLDENGLLHPGIGILDSRIKPA